jgi:hypothetical protein
MARVLAPAANLDPSLLKGHNSAAAVAACIRCASIVGSNSMLEIIETYASYPGDEVWSALLSAWTAFDEQEYFDKIILKRTEQTVGGFALSTLNADSLLVFRLLATRGLSIEMSRAMTNYWLLAERSG